MLPMAKEALSCDLIKDMLPKKKKEESEMCEIFIRGDSAMILSIMGK